MLFNPSEYTLSRSSKFDASKPPGKGKPKTTYSGGNPDQLSLTLLFDGTGAAGKQTPVDEDVKRFMDLLSYRGSVHKTWYVKLTWSKALQFQGYVKSATATFTLFDRDGRVLRAKVAASFEEVIAPKDLSKIEDTGSPDRFHFWTVSAGDTLDGIAREVYGDAAFWRELAKSNDLENPRALREGAVLRRGVLPTGDPEQARQVLGLLLVAPPAELGPTLAQLEGATRRVGR